jgi:dipeptidyl aminopeptidase/acylaminoacyl peptidase
MDNSYRAPQQSTERAKRRQLLRDTYGEFNPESDFWKKVAPTNYLDGVTSAILLNHAVNDDVVNVSYSRNLDEVLDKTDIPHELNEYATGGHNITGASFNSAMEATVNFFREYLK